jgi:hypothetical protein
MNVSYICLFCLFPIFQSLKYNSRHLTGFQQTTIRNLLQHPDLSEKQHTVINNILFSHYVPWAKKKAYEFKKDHGYICKNIFIEDLLAASFSGLYKGTVNYNGLGTYTNYVNYYISGELYKCTNKHRFVDMPHIPSAYVPIQTSHYVDYWTHILSTSNFTNIENRILKYKFAPDFNKLCSNKHIAELMCCSEETIRIHVKNIAKKIDKGYSL